MTRNAATRKDIRLAEKEAELRERARIEFVFAAMGTPQGRTYFHDLLARCHIFATTFTGEALSSVYSEGERNIGLQVYNDIVNHCPDQFVVMMKEAAIKELTNARRSEPASPDEPDSDDDPEFDPYASPTRE